MKNSITLEHYNRSDGTIEVESVFASKFLYWSYNNKLGRALTRYLFSRRFISKLYGWFAKTKLSKKLILSMVQNRNIDKTTVINSFDCYNSFNSFFVRKLSQTERPIDTTPESLISPSDGKVFAFENIGRDETFCIKRNLFNLTKFLQNENITNEFSGGSMIVVRLSLSDYHHFSFPVSGFVYKTTDINGKLYAGGSYSLRDVTPFYTENLRQISLINSDHFGLVAQIEIGAFTVGSIKQSYKTESRICKGDSKGFFELGGSTIVLLFKKDKLIIDNDILENSKKSVETKVVLGERIGCYKTEKSFLTKESIK